MKRRIRRNILKRELGTYKIRREWRKMQIACMGLVNWVRTYNRCNPKTKTCRVTRQTAYIE